MRVCIVLALLGSFVGVARGQILPPGLPARSPLQGASAQIPVTVVRVGNINFAKPEKLVITLRPDQSTSTYVWLLSDTDSLTGIQFYLSLRRTSDSTPCQASVLTLPTAPGFLKDKSRPIPIEITGCGGNEAEGFLGILGSSGENREIPIVVKRWTSPWLTRVLFTSLVLALSIAFVCGAIASDHGHKLTDVIGSASWDFSSSWASNIAAFGTAFSFLIQLTIFPDKPLLGSRSEYTFLAGLALALVGLAPAAQRLTGQIRASNVAGVPAMVTNSSVAGFLVASVFTMWGSLQQIATQVLTVFELGTTAIIKREIAICTELCLVLAGVGLVVYCWRSILLTIATNATRTGVKKGTLEMFSGTAPDEAHAITRKIPLL
jgi:hypothetical protein